jgi:hypothetical protein
VWPPPQHNLLCSNGWHIRRSKQFAGDRVFQQHPQNDNLSVPSVVARFDESFIPIRNFFTIPHVRDFCGLASRTFGPVYLSPLVVRDDVALVDSRNIPYLSIKERSQITLDDGNIDLISGPF